MRIITSLIYKDEFKNSKILCDKNCKFTHNDIPTLCHALHIREKEIELETVQNNAKSLNKQISLQPYFYRATHYSAKRAIEIACRPSVRVSDCVCL